MAIGTEQGYQAVASLTIRPGRDSDRKLGKSKSDGIRESKEDGKLGSTETNCWQLGFTVPSGEMLRLTLDIFTINFFKTHIFDRFVIVQVISSTQKLAPLVNIKTVKICILIDIFLFF